MSDMIQHRRGMASSVIYVCQFFGYLFLHLIHKSITSVNLQSQFILANNDHIMNITITVIYIRVNE